MTPLPCPFCGSPAKESFDEKCDEWWIVCGNDSCGVAPTVAMNDLRDARTTWNQRTPPEAAAIALLREARPCVEYCVHVDDGSWAQVNPHLLDLLRRIDDCLPHQEGSPK